MPARLHQASNVSLWSAWRPADVLTVAVAVEGESDVAAVESMLGTRSIRVDAQRIFRTSGKAKLDRKIRGYNQAAAQSPWLVLRDADHDEGGCAAALRESRLPANSQNPGLSFRLAVRSIEAWLLADAEAFAATFLVPASIVPSGVEQLPDPKQTLGDLCRRSRKPAIRKAMAPPPGSAGRVGPEYVSFLSQYSRTAWRPNVAAANAPSLARALREIDRLLANGIWR